jgi:DNA primase
MFWGSYNQGYDRGMDGVAAVKERLAIEDVVGDYLELRRAGSSLKGLCPFHDEKTPSFNVARDRGIYHCFGCGEGGDMFDFVMKMDGLDFPQALEKLARKAGVELEQYGRDGKTTERKKIIIALHQLAANFYQATLLRTPVAMDYLRDERRLHASTIKYFDIGYAPDGYDQLWQALQKKNVRLDDAVLAGLVKQKNGRTFDVFRGRIVIGLHNPQGQLIGFTGRVLDDSQPKYLNTSKTLVYDKSRHVFGWHLAQASIRKADLAILAEGNMDVVASHQAGVKNVVATAGTAITIDQLRAISRITENIAFALDSDSAGISASVRAISLAQQLDINLSVIAMPEGADPDSMISNEPSSWSRAIEQRAPAMDWLIELYATRFDLKTVEGKRKFNREIIPLLRQINNPVTFEHYQKVIAKRLDVSISSIKRLVENRDNSIKKSDKKAAYQVAAIDEIRQLEETLLGIASAYPESAKEVIDIESELFPTEVGQQLHRYLKQNIDPEQDSGLSEVSNYEKIVKFRAEELFGEWTAHEREQEASNLLRRVLQNAKKRQQNNLTTAIKQAEAAGDHVAAAKLLEKYQATVLGIEPTEGEANLD